MSIGIANLASPLSSDRLIIFCICIATGVTCTHALDTPCIETGCMDWVEMGISPLLLFGFSRKEKEKKIDVGGGGEREIVVLSRFQHVFPGLQQH